MTIGQKRIFLLSLDEKYEKRKSIARATCDLFIEKGYVKITISEIAKVANIGKGTIYQYFKNKEDVLFELMACLQEEYDPKLNKKLEANISAKQKLIYLFYIFLGDDEIVRMQRKIYKEFLSIYIHNKTEIMDRYNKSMMDKYHSILENIFKEAIKKNELSSSSLNFIPSIFATLQGFFITCENKTVMYDYIDSLFILLEIKK